MSTFSKLFLFFTSTFNFFIYAAQPLIPEGTKLIAGTDGKVELYISEKKLIFSIHDKNPVSGALSIKEKLDNHQPCISVALIDESGSPTCFDYTVINIQRILQNPHKHTLSFFQWKKVGNVYEMHCNTQLILKENPPLAKKLGISFNRFNPETAAFIPQTDASFQQYPHPAHIIPHFTEAYSHVYNQQHQFFPHYPHSLTYGPMATSQITMPGNPHVIPHYLYYQEAFEYHPPQPHHFNQTIDHRRSHPADVTQGYSPQQIPAALPSQSVAQPLSPEMQDLIKKMNELAAQNQQLLELVKEKTVAAVEQKKQEAVTEKIDTMVMNKLVAQLNASGQELLAQQQVSIQMIEEAPEIQHKESETLEKDTTVASEGLQEIASDSCMGSPLSRKTSTASLGSPTGINLAAAKPTPPTEHRKLQIVQEEPTQPKKELELQQAAPLTVAQKTIEKTDSEKEARKLKKQQTREAERLKRKEDAAGKAAEKKEVERLEKEKAKRAKEEQEALKKKHQKDQRDSLSSRQMQSHIPALKELVKDTPPTHVPHRKKQQPQPATNKNKDDDDFAVIAAFKAQSEQESLTQQPVTQPRTLRELKALRALTTKGQKFLADGLYQKAIDIFTSEDFVRLNKGKSLLLVEAYRQAEMLQEAFECLKEIKREKSPAEEYDYQTALCSIMAAQKNRSLDKSDLIKHFDVLSKKLQEKPCHIETTCALTTLLTSLDEEKLAEKENEIALLFGFLNVLPEGFNIATTHLLRTKLSEVLVQLGNPRTKKLIATLYNVESPVEELLKTDFCPSLAHAATALVSALFSKKKALTNDESVALCLYGAIADSPFYLERSIECLVYLKSMDQPHPVLTRLIPLLKEIAIAKSQKILKEKVPTDYAAILSLLNLVTSPEEHQPIKEKLANLINKCSLIKNTQLDRDSAFLQTYVEKTTEFIKKIKDLGSEKDKEHQQELLHDLCTPKWHQELFDYAKDPGNYCGCDIPENRVYGYAIILCIKQLYDTAIGARDTKKIEELKSLIETIKNTFPASGNTEMYAFFKERFPEN